MADNVLMVGLTVYDGEDEDLVLKQCVLNFKDPKARQVIARTAWWAMHSGHEMVTWRLQNGERLERIDSRECR